MIKQEAQDKERPLTESFIRELNRTILVPVSYTHLDVYKRQTYTFLKSFLADTKGIVNIFRRTFIVQIDPSAMFPNILQQCLREIIDFLKSRFLKYQVHLTLFAYLRCV